MSIHPQYTQIHLKICQKSYSHVDYASIPVTYRKISYAPKGIVTCWYESFSHGAVLETEPYTAYRQYNENTVCQNPVTVSLSVPVLAYK